MWPMTLINICLLRADPQDLPASTPLTALALLVYFAADVAAVSQLVPFTRALQAAAADTMLVVVLTLLALSLRERMSRSRQTLMALAGGGAVLGAVGTVVGSLMPTGTSPLVLSVPALLWLLAVYGHVLRHAIEVPYAMGVALTCAYLFMSVVVVGPFLITPQIVN